MIRRTLLFVILAAVPAISGVGWWIQSDNDFDMVVPSSSQPSPTSSNQIQARDGHSRSSTASVVEKYEALNARYEACVLAAGFDPGGVQVLLWESGAPSPRGAQVPESGTPWWVKTGRDVPAEIHRPCFILIGGVDPQRSSHGTPTTLQETRS